MSSDDDSPPKKGPASHDPDFLARVRRAIADEDQSSALRLLRQLAEGDTATESLTDAVGDALVATARGSNQDESDRAALARLKSVEHRRDEVIQLVDGGDPFSMKTHIWHIRRQLGLVKG